jgi:hypothetical protein
VRDAWPWLLGAEQCGIALEALALGQSVKCNPIVFDLFELGFVIPPGLWKCSFGLCDLLLPPSTLLLHWFLGIIPTLVQAIVRQFTQVE